MAKKYKIAFMPGDGIGNDVLEAAKIVMDEGTDFNAEFIQQCRSSHPCGFREVLPLRLDWPSPFFVSSSKRP